MKNHILTQKQPVLRRCDQMICNEKLGLIAQGDAAALEELHIAVTGKTLTKAETGQAWKAVIEAAASGKGSPGKLMDVAHDMSDTSKCPEARELYEKLFMLAIAPVNRSAYAPIINVGAGMVRVNSGIVKDETLDAGWYLETAKRCLIRCLGATEEAIKTGMTGGRTIGDIGMTVKDLEQNIIFTVEALVHTDGWEAKGAIAAVLKGGHGDAVNVAAGKCMEPLRIRQEIEWAQADRELLSKIVYPDPTSLQHTYIECLFEAVETAYAPGAEARVVAEAVRQLSSFEANTEAAMEMYDSRALGIISRNVENALVHALTNHEGRIRESAADALQKLGTDRIENILERVVARAGEASEVGSLASEALSCIRGAKVQILFEAELAPMAKPPARKAQEPPRIGGPTARAPVTI
jgi:hypothetical protein